MSQGQNKQKEFIDILDDNASLDDIFKDSESQKGTSPFADDQISEVSLEDTTLFDNENISLISRKLNALESLMGLINKDNSFGEFISDILKISLEAVKSEAGSFFEVDYLNNNLFFRAVSGRSAESLLSVTIPRGKGVIGFVAENQQPLTISDLDENTMHLRSISASVGFEARNIIAYPIIIRGKTFGCIELLNRLGAKEYNNSDKEVLGEICKFAAKIIENRLLLASATKKLEVA